MRADRRNALRIRQRGPHISSDDLPNSFLRTISTTVAPYAYSIPCSRAMWEKLVFALRLAWSVDIADGIVTRSVLSSLMRRMV